MNYVCCITRARGLSPSFPEGGDSEARRDHEAIGDFTVNSDPIPIPFRGVSYFAKRLGYFGCQGTSNLASLSYNPAAKYQIVLIRFNVMKWSSPPHVQRYADVLSVRQREHTSYLNLSIPRIIGYGYHLITKHPLNESQILFSLYIYHLQSHI